MTTSPHPNTLYYGDNLAVLRRYLPDSSVDLIYADPPFNSARNYNVLFKDSQGQDSSAQVEAFKDSWTWDHDAEAAYTALFTGDASTGVPPTPVAVQDILAAAVKHILRRGPMAAYLVMMAARLVECHRVLKPTGSMYLHCDPTAGHYLRLLMDAVFGPENFRNEITWKRSDAHNDARRKFPEITDRILFYVKDARQYKFHKQHIGFPQKTLKEWYLHLELPDGTTRRMTREERETQRIPEDARRFNTDNLRSPRAHPNLIYDYKGYKPHKNGWSVTRPLMEELDQQGLLLFPSKPTGRIMRKKYLDESGGPLAGDVWTDISQLRGHSKERLGYPTQKPIALLERIISASSDPGDVVLDPFCGCGTTIAAAHKLGRRWVGIDITHLSTALLKYRLADMFQIQVGRDYALVGEPEDVGGARDLANHDRYQFQFWALSLVRAMPLTGREETKGARGGKKGPDRGVDGIITFMDKAATGTSALVPHHIVVQVKSGKVGSPDLRDLRGVLERDEAAIGVFITLEEPTRDMTTEAAAAGHYTSHLTGAQYLRLQVLTIAALLAGAQVQRPTHDTTFKTAPKTADASTPRQAALI